MESIVSFGIISVLIVVAPFISSILRLPLVVTEIMLGAIAFYFGLFSHSQSLEFMAHIGFLFLMFLCGLEVNLKALKELGASFLKSALSYLFIMYALALLYVWYMDISIFYVAALSVMSLGMIMMLIKEYPKNTDWLQLSLNIGILGELISIIILVIINGGYSYGLTWKLYETLLILFLFLTAIVGIFKIADILFWWFPTLKFMLMPQESSKNQDIRFSSMLFLVMIGIVTLLGLESVLGAFLAGMILATYFHYHSQLAEKLNDFGFGFFIPLFFIYVGSTLDLELIVEHPYLFSNVFQIILVMVLIRTIGALLIYKKYFASYKKVLLLGFSHAMPLTFLVATAQLGKQFNVINNEEYYTFILAALLEGILLILCIKFIANFKFIKEKR